MTIWDKAKAEKNWLPYRLVQRAGNKPQKIPQSQNGTNIGAKQAAVLNFDEAWDLAQSLGDDYGIGYLPRAGSAIVCVDFDGVLKDGQVNQADIPEFNSYTEISPSGTGLHVLIARPLDKEPITFDDGNDWVGYIGSDSKFFTVSLDRWGKQTEIEDDPELVDWVMKRNTEVLGANKTEISAPKGKRVVQSSTRAKTSRANWFEHLPAHLKAKCAAEMLSTLPPKFASGYDTWIAVGMALKLVDEGYELFDVWDEWSKTASNYDVLLLDKWNGFAINPIEPKELVTIGTLIRWAQKHGWEPEAWQRVAQNFKLNGSVEDLAAKIAKTAKTPRHKPNIQEDTNKSTKPKDQALLDEYLTRPGGLVEDLTDFGAQRSNRLTRLPALGGALAAVSALTQRRYIIVTPGFQTSPGLQVVVVGETGTGKEITRDIVHEICRLSDDIFLAEAYASSAAMHRALNHKPVQMWANDEFGRFLKAASKDTNGGHDYGIITMAMKLHTMYAKTLPERIYSSENPKPAVNHPLLITAHTTTPKALNDAMSVDTVVDGMLGRMLVLKVDGTPLLKLLSEVNAAALPSEISRQIEGLRNKFLAEGLKQNQATMTVDGMDGHMFIAITPEKAAEQRLEGIRQECEEQATTGVARALWSRAYEQILRVAGVVAFGQAFNDDCLHAPKITEDILLWAKSFVYKNLEELIPEAEEHASDGDRDKLQKGILRSLKKLEEKAGPDRWVRKTGLLQKVKGRGRNYPDLKNEITALAECGDIEFECNNDGSPSRPERLRTVAL